MSIQTGESRVARALQSRDRYLTESLTALRRAEFSDFDPERYHPYLRALLEVNEHITVPSKYINAASAHYTEVGESLLRDLNWPDETISVYAQGSAATSTLIYPPDNSKFDIDAVCEVDLSRVDAKDPMGFFEAVGEVLEQYDAEAKKRCWSLPCVGDRFYIEFTPSVPLGTIDDSDVERLAPLFSAGETYRATSLAVVDCPTARWKTSNPSGFAAWVDESAKYRLLIADKLDRLVVLSEDVESVPTQVIEDGDVLRLSIRLLKRHRDMCVYRNLVSREHKPISVIIVTLLTACYSGLAHLARRYAHPLDLLAEMVELIPLMVRGEDGSYHVDNPTVAGENFAEKWNADGGRRAKEFGKWVDILQKDIKSILGETSEARARERARKVFGCTAASTDPDDTELKSRNLRPPAVHVKDGLA